MEAAEAASVEAPAEADLAEVASEAEASAEVIITIIITADTEGAGSSARDITAMATAEAASAVLSV